MRQRWRVLFFWTVIFAGTAEPEQKNRNARARTVEPAVFDGAQSTTLSAQ